jgi:hypothetical protein
MTDRLGLSQIELVLLSTWIIADGKWDRVDLAPESGRELLLHKFRCLKGDPFTAVKYMRVGLQHSLMAARLGTFEEIQQESPFRQDAEVNMARLLRAWTDEAEVGVAREWSDVFRPGWEANRIAQEPVRIIVDTGDCEEHALVVKGAPDRTTRVSAEWWYLYYILGRAWQPLMHCTQQGKQGTHFSVHHIRVPSRSPRKIFFRLPS